MKVSVSGIKMQLNNRQILEVYTTEQEHPRGAVALSKWIFREDTGGASVYYIYDEDKLVVIRDDERVVDEIVKRVKEVVAGESAEKFHFSSCTVKELDDGIHIEGGGEASRRRRRRIYLIKPRVLPPLAVYFDGKEAVVPWNVFTKAVVFAVKFVFSDEKGKVKMLYEVGKSFREIAMEVGMSYTKIKDILAKSGAERKRELETLKIKSSVKRKRTRVKKKTRLTEEEIEKIVKMYKEGKSIYRIAKELKRSEYAVYSHLKRLGFKQ